MSPSKSGLLWLAVLALPASLLAGCGSTPPKRAASTSTSSGGSIGTVGGIIAGSSSGPGSSSGATSGTSGSGTSGSATSGASSANGSGTSASSNTTASSTGAATTSATTGTSASSSSAGSTSGSPGSTSSATTASSSGSVGTSATTGASSTGTTGAASTSSASAASSTGGTSGGASGTGTGSTGSVSTASSSSGSSGTSGVTDFGHPCTSDTDCQSGVCVQTSDGTSVCTEDCTLSGTCPNSDYRCGPLTSASGAPSYCLPRYNNLCKPCAADADCALTRGGTLVPDSATCLPFVADGGSVVGSFCTIECDNGTLLCPSGYACKTLAGSADKQCVKTDQQCSCQTTWQDPETSCSTANAFGTCTGSRMCADGGLSACSAQVPSAEVCNGLDDNCDGQTDEGGDALCSNNGLACVTATCGGASGCQLNVNAGSCLIDGTTCVAAGTPNPNNPCEACDPASSATSWTVRVNQACDDGDPCTTGEVCNPAGQCLGGSLTDCSAFGNPPCSSGICQAGVGCVAVNHDGVACDDGKFCTVGETCSNGLCGAGAGAGTARDCSAFDALPCTSGACDETNDTCFGHVNQGVACDDGNPCSTASACNSSGVCAATALKDCSAQNDTCNVGVCDTSTGNCGKQAANIGASCDDQNACTGNGTCSNQGGVGVCSGAATVGDSFEPNDSTTTAKAVTNIDDCGNVTGSLSATINPGTDTDWYSFALNNSSSFCNYGTQVTLTPPTGGDYDLVVCVSQSKSFSATCSSGSSIAAPSGLSGYQCCQSASGGAGAAEYIKIDWGCSGTFCSDATGSVYMHVVPHGGTQTPRCSPGYTLSWVDD